MSPILVRPVREQFEHDRIIRLLQAKGRRKFEIGINPGVEQNAPVGPPARREFPDLVLMSTDKTHRLLGVVEVETGESINHLEALAQWAHYARLKVPFTLYVPAGSVDVARRLCEEHQIDVAEIWTYHPVGDQLRFLQVFKSPAARQRAADGKPAPAARSASRKTPARTAKAAPRGAKAARPAKGAAAKTKRKAAARPPARPSNRVAKKAVKRKAAVRRK